MAINIRNDKNHRSASTCSFCRGSHTITSCPEILRQAKLGKNLLFIQRTYEQHYAMQYVKLKEDKATKKKANTARSCGYCGGTGHTRRNCMVMDEDRAFLSKANRVWRQIYAKASVEHGFAPASLVKHTVSNRYNYKTQSYEDEESLLLIGSELPTNLSVFSLASDYNMRQDIRIPAVGRNHPLSMSEFIGGLDWHNALAGKTYYWGKADSTQVITPSTYQYADEWIYGECDDIQFALKKWKKKRLDEALIENIKIHLVPFAKQLGLWD